MDAAARTPFNRHGMTEREPLLMALELEVSSTIHLRTNYGHSPEYRRWLEHDERVGRAVTRRDALNTLHATDKRGKSTELGRFSGVGLSSVALVSAIFL